MPTASCLVALLAALSVLLGPRQACGFIRIMGDSDINCGFEGSYCYSDTVCCSGLVCRYGYKRYGGICEREIPRGFDDFNLPRRIDCQSDSDCPPGRCCVSSSIGYRGASIRSCRDECQAKSEKDVDTILGEFYNRYYRSSYRKKRSVHAGSD